MYIYIARVSDFQLVWVTLLLGREHGSDLVRVNESKSTYQFNLNITKKKCTVHALIYLFIFLLYFSAGHIFFLFGK